MKSMIEYDFDLGNSELDLRSISHLDFTCADFSIIANFIDKVKQDKALQILGNVSERYPSSSLKKLTIHLTSNLHLQFLG